MVKRWGIVGFAAVLIGVAFVGVVRAGDVALTGAGQDHAGGSVVTMGTQSFSSAASEDLPAKPEVRVRALSFYPGDPIGGIDITGSPAEAAGVTPYSFQPDWGTCVTLKAPERFTDQSGETFSFYEWRVFWYHGYWPTVQNGTELTIQVASSGDSRDVLEATAYYEQACKLTVQSTPVTGVRIKGSYQHHWRPAYAYDASGITSYTTIIDPLGDLTLQAPLVVASNGGLATFVCWRYMEDASHPWRIPEPGPASIVLELKSGIETTAEAVYTYGTVLTITRADRTQFATLGDFTLKTCDEDGKVVDLCTLDNGKPVDPYKGDNSRPVNPYHGSTLELPDRPKPYDLGKGKRPGPKMYPIPAGVYKAKLGSHKGSDGLLLVNTPDYDGIFITNGNYPWNTTGCILVGEGRISRFFFTNGKDTTPAPPLTWKELVYCKALGFLAWLTTKTPGTVPVPTMHPAQGYTSYVGPKSVPTLKRILRHYDAAKQKYQPNGEYLITVIIE